MGEGRQLGGLLFIRGLRHPALQHTAVAWEEGWLRLGQPLKREPCPRSVAESCEVFCRLFAFCLVLLDKACEEPVKYLLTY